MCFSAIKQNPGGLRADSLYDFTHCSIRCTSYQYGDCRVTRDGRSDLMLVEGQQRTSRCVTSEDSKLAATPWYGIQTQRLH